MKTKSGIWVDHREAVVATVNWRGETLEVIPSNVEKHPSHSGVANGRVEHDLFRRAHDDTRDRAYHEHLRRFYDEVIGAVLGSDSILIMGPGEAKHELRRRLEEKHLEDRIRSVETADKMTGPQILARARERVA